MIKEGSEKKPQNRVSQLFLSPGRPTKTEPSSQCIFFNTVNKHCIRLVNVKGKNTDMENPYPVVVPGPQPSPTWPEGCHFLKRLKSGCTCFVEALLRAEWYSMYTVSSAPDMELMVPKRRDACGGPSPQLVSKGKTLLL